MSDWSSDVCSSDLGGVIASTGFVDRHRQCALPDVTAFIDVIGATIQKISANCIEAQRLSVTTIIVSAKKGAFGDLFISHFCNCVRGVVAAGIRRRSEEHTSELQSLMRISYAVFCLKKKTR